MMMGESLGYLRYLLLSMHRHLTFIKSSMDFNTQVLQVVCILTLLSQHMLSSYVGLQAWIVVDCFYNGHKMQCLGDTMDIR